MVVCCSNENSSLNANPNVVSEAIDAKVVSGNVPQKTEPPTTERATSIAGASTEVLTERALKAADLARPRNTGLAPSLQELEKIYSEKQRQRLAEARRQNDKTMYNAIHHPDTNKTVQPRSLTVPREFNLSCPNTPSRSRCATPSGTPSRSRCATPLRSQCGTPARSVCMSSDGSSRGTPCSSRGRATSRGRASSSKPLTVPYGPDLRVSYRPRSLSGQRSSDVDNSIWKDDLRGQAKARSASRANSRRVSASPSRSVRSGWSYGMVTPRSHRSRDDSCGSISSDMALSMPCSSVRSRMERSCDSRVSQRSRSSSRQKLSTEEIEELRIAAKRHQVKELMKLNATRGRQAILCPQPSCSRRSVSLTVPQEFSLSCPATPSRSCMSDAGSDAGEEGTWSHSLRSRPPSAPLGPIKTWQPVLTAPQAPNLRTAQRSRSSSRHRSASGTPSKRSMSRHRLPREQAAIERHLERSVGQVFEDHSSIQSDKPAWDDSTKEEQVSSVATEITASKSRSEHPVASEGQASEADATKQREGDLDCKTPEERAKRAREVAEQKYKEKAAEKVAHLKCFTGPKAQPLPRRGRSGKPAASHGAMLDRPKSSGHAAPVHERLYQEKDKRRHRLEEAQLQKIEQEEDDIRASAQRALSPGRTAGPGCAASPGRTASPGRAASPGRGASPAASPESKKPE